MLEPVFLNTIQSLNAMGSSSVLPATLTLSHAQLTAISGQISPGHLALSKRCYFHVVHFSDVFVPQKLGK